MHTAVRLDSLIYMVENGQIVGIHKVLDTEELLSLLYTVRKQGSGLCLLVDDIIGGVILLLLLRVNLHDLHGSQCPRELVSSLIQVGRLVAASRNDERSSRFVYEDRVHLIDYGEIHFALHFIRLAYAHIITQIIEAVLIVGAVGDIARVRFSALIVFFFVYYKPHCEPEKPVDTSDKLTVAFCEVVVDRDHMDALAGERVQI